MANRASKSSFPLQGKRIVLTQSSDQIDKLEKLLYVEQAFTIKIPSIEFQLVKQLEPIRQAIRSIGDYDLLILTSQNSFQFFNKVMKEEHVTRLPPKTKIAVVGDETKKMVEKEGFIVSFVPEDKKNSEHLAELLIQKMNLDRKKVLFPKSSLSNSQLPDKLRKQGAWVNDIVLYETMMNQESQMTFNSVFGYPVDWILFSSPSAVRSFFSYTTAENVQSWIFDLGIKIGSIGETTTKAILEHRIPVSVQSPRPSVKVLVETIKEFEEYEQF